MSRYKEICEADSITKIRNLGGKKVDNPLKISAIASWTGLGSGIAGKNTLGQVARCFEWGGKNVYIKLAGGKCWYVISLEGDNGS